ncbi:Maf family protein [Aquimarina sediminis]|uniref:hypothetical protein n=1 Tax=Aquimarina sediminis TaxID=2070536 RepID=UPI000CA03BF9|nr:hypothetical protein [Aquimarina sediminis]
MKGKIIYLLTRNNYKLKEYQEFFHNYNITVKKIADFTPFKDAKELLERYYDILKKPQVFTVVFDETHLFSKKDNTRIYNVNKDNDLELVYTKTILYYLEGENISSISSTTYDGVIDYAARKKETNVFGWDDIFILKSTGLSYQELKDRKMKNHCRQEVLSNFVENYLYYRENIDLNYNKLNQKEVIEFSNKIFDFVATNRYLNLESVKEKKLNVLFQYALNNGGFFRSSKNRRQKNYWVPGLNAGIPLVPKSDEIHEITFFVHDLCHFIIPDLIFNGVSNTLYDNVYIIYRMMSEALTQVVADMIFIDCLVKDEVTYDFSKRKIYPLYAAITRKNPHVTLKELMYANVQYSILGDDSGYKKLIDINDIPVLVDFKKKYETFFIEDFKWTQRNLENMKANSKSFGRWSKENQDVFKDQQLYTIEEYVTSVLHLELSSSIATSQLVNLIFNQVMNQYDTILNSLQKYSIEEQISNSFKKYMLGQIMIFYRIDFLHYSRFVKNKIAQQLRKQQISLSDIRRIRSFYNDYLSLLESEYHLINKDDMETFKEVYPIFDTFFVFYDTSKEKHDNLKQVAAQYLKN